MTFRGLGKAEVEQTMEALTAVNTSEGLAFMGIKGDKKKKCITLNYDWKKLNYAGVHLQGIFFLERISLKRPW